jgi:hypothetical protein
LQLILGGEALQRCGNCIVLNLALAAEVLLSARERFSRTLPTLSRVLNTKAFMPPVAIDLNPLN